MRTRLVLTSWRWLLGAIIALLGCGSWSVGCGPAVKCGTGTVLKEGVCVVIARESGVGKEHRVEIGGNKESQATDGGPDAMHEGRPLEGTGEAQPGKTGEPCDLTRPCAKGPCLRDGYCSAPCSKGDDCPVGMLCREINHKQPDGSFKTFTGCVRPPEKQKLCKRDKDCASHQSCVTTLSPKGDAIVQVCMTSIPGGKLPGESCDATKGLQCRNSMCLNDTFCSALCTVSEDCPAGWACEQVSIALPNGKQAQVQACTPGRKVCKRDADCPKGLICRSFVSQDQTKLEFLCATPNKAGAQAGDACDAATNGCYNFLCVDAGFCLAICQTDADCREGFSCVEVDAILPKGKFKFKGCAIKSIPCERNGDCPTGLVCALAVNQAQDKITPFCAIRRLHTLPAGKACKPGSQVAAEQCSNHMCLSHGYCSALCKDDKDCPKDFVCSALTVQLPKNPNASVNGCIKKAP